MLIIRSIDSVRSNFDDNKEENKSKYRHKRTLLAKQNKYTEGDGRARARVR